MSPAPDIPPAADDPRLVTNLAGLRLRNPVLTASGTGGYGPEYAGVLDYRRLGGFTTKSVTREERPGNEPQRLVEVRAGLLNAIGLANVGLTRFLREKLPFIQTMPTAVLVNVAGHRLEDYVEIAAALDEHPAVAAIELNVSCPNVADGLMFGTDPALLQKVVAATRRVLKRAKLVVKLSPNVTDIAVFARAAGVPIIGMGGIQSTPDAIEFFLAGASAVAVGTALFIDPTIPLKIAAGLADYLTAHNLPHISALTGQLQLR